MENYEKQIKENEKRNKKFIDEFEKYLKEKDLVEKTIKNHINNIKLYLNDYLNYYEFVKMEDGISRIDSFLGDWFIRKCMWSSKTSIKETAASIKKFYQAMLEYQHITKEDYQYVCDEIKENMECWLDSLEMYDDDSFYDWI